MMIAAAVVVGLVVLILVLKPGDRGGRHDARFVALDAELKRAGPGRNHALLDLDALERNADAIRAAVRPDIALRLVSKSLPSMPLLTHLMRRLETDRLMVFTEPYLDAVLHTFGTDVDVLLGKPLPAVAAGRLMATHDTSRVCWLVDHVARLEAYLAIAQQAGQMVRICVEVDVGLRRGGAMDAADLEVILDRIAAHPAALRFGGLMGYDGHVPHAPPVIADSDDEFAALHRRYADLVAAAKAKHPGLFGPDVIFDSGGSGTYARYTADLDSPVDELSIGSAFLAPTHFPAQREAGLEPALMLATPVLKRLETPLLPFETWVGPLLARWNPNFAVHFFLHGGGWPADPLSPPGLTFNPLWADGTVTNLLPNQPLVTGSTAVELAEGDFVFFDPWQGDAMLSMAELTVLRDGRVVEAWPTYRGGN